MAHSVIDKYTELKDVVAIDGPVGVGKSSVAQAVAQRLGFRHLNTGAMYRAVVWRYLQLPAEERRRERLGEIAGQLNLDFDDDGRVFLDGADRTLALREEEVSRHVHLSADDRAVREALVGQQRRIGSARASVLEGRDIATVVFPDARWKIYLDAAPRERAARRLRQLERLGRPGDPEKVLRDLIDRDRRDRQRPWGALRISPGATVLDTTEIPENRVVELICALVRGL